MGRVEAVTCGRRLAAVVLVGAFALLAFPGAAPARADDAPIPRTAEFKKRVAEAIAQGVAWLKSQQVADGRFGEWGTDIADVARAYHALRVCGVPADDPVAVRAYDWLRKEYDEDEESSREDGEDWHGTEDMGWLLWAIADRAQAQPPADETEEVSYSPSPKDLAWMKRIAAYLEKVQLANGSWPAHPSVHEAGEADQWHMHLALLGLKLASRAGVKVKTTTWSKALVFLLNQQESPGKPVPQPPVPKGAPAPKPVRARGWDMHEKKGSADFFPMDSETAEALTSVAICRSEILRFHKGKASPDPRTEAAIRDGLAFLAQDLHTFEMLEDPEERDDLEEYHFEHAFGLERAGDLLGVERFGASDWFGRGAGAILANQEESGAWLLARVRKVPRDDADMYRNYAIEATCHALLFLARGTPRARWTTTVGGDDTDIRFDAAAALAEKDFEDFLDLVLARWGRAADAAVKDRLLAKATAVGPRIVAPLVRRLASEEEEVRAASAALLKRATDLDHGYDPRAPEAARTEAIARWQAWWDANGKTLRYDAAQGRLVP